MSKRIARIVLGLLLAGAAAVLAWRLPNGVETDLYGLADSRQAGVLREIASGLAGQGRVLLAGPAGDLDPLKRRAAEIRARLLQLPKADYKETLAFIDSHKAGLLAPATRSLLASGKFQEVAEAAAARLFSPMPPLFSVKRDPFLLGTDYAMSLEAGFAEGWSLDDGELVCERDDTAYLLLPLDFSRTGAGGGGMPPVDTADIVSFLNGCERLSKDEENPFKIWCSGPPFHSARATAHAKREINLLSSVSIAFVVLFGWLLFRSLRFLPMLLLAQAVGFLGATGALFAVFPRPHVLTFVFGTSLIGLSVDYVYHVRAAGGAEKIFRPLTYSLLTTVACFAPLLFAEVAVLRQMALFTIAGLVAVYAWVSTTCCSTLAVTPGAGRNLPCCSTLAVTPFAARNDSKRTTARWRWAGVIAVVLLVALGVPKARLVEDPATFYRPDAYLAASEAKLFQVSPVQTGRFAYVPGRTLQEALENEEAAGVKGLSAFIPSLKRQRENAALKAALRQKAGPAYTAQYGIKMPAAETDGFLDPEQLPEGPLRAMVASMRTAGGLVSPLPESSNAQPGDSPKFQVIEPKAALAELFHHFTQATWKLLAYSFGMFLLLLVVFFRGAFFRFAWPVLLALVATVGVLGLLQIPITFFTLLCFFVLMGLGIDYSIFHRGHPAPETRRVVRFAFLTSFVGLGMLACTQFPVTHSMGVAFAFGLFFAYVFSMEAVAKTGGAGKGGVPSPIAWHEQGEQSAGRLRMLALWCLYRCLGKGVQKIAVVFVMLFIYPFARPAKKALRDFHAVLSDFAPAALPKSIFHFPFSTFHLYRHLLGFAWSLCDKTDVCSLKKNLPTMQVRDDEGWRAFQSLVAARQGAFLVSTHVGTIEVLPALARNVGDGRVPHVHAFQQMGHDAEFTRMFMRHFDHSAMTLHAVEAIGVETAVDMQAAIQRGELVLMAGDRVSAGSHKTLVHDFLGRSCRWPKGVFTFAKLMESPVFFVTCVRTGWNAYEVHVKQFIAAPVEPGRAARPLAAELLAQYVAFLEAETVAHPEQWYQFYDFFGEEEGKAES